MTNSRNVRTVVFCLCLVIFAGCTYKDRVSPVQLPDASDRTVVVGDGLLIAAKAFVQDNEAKDAFGFDIRKAGLLPVQMTFQNDGSRTVKVLPDQTFLLDESNNAWPVSSLERTYDRTKNYVDIGETMKGAGKPAVLMGAAGAVAGLAVGIITGENIGEAMGKGAVVGGAAGAVMGGASQYEKAGRKIRNDLADKSLKNTVILPNQIAYGVLFFPGLSTEAQTARELRLAVQLDNQTQIVRVSLQ